MLSGPENDLKAFKLRAVLTDAHFWVPVVVLLLGSWLLVIFAVSP